METVILLSRRSGDFVEGNSVYPRNPELLVTRAARHARKYISLRLARLSRSGEVGEGRFCELIPEHFDFVEVSHVKKSNRSISIAGLSVRHSPLRGVLRDPAGASERPEAVHFHHRRFHLHVRYTDAE